MGTEVVVPLARTEAAGRASGTCGSSIGSGLTEKRLRMKVGEYEEFGLKRESRLHKEMREQREREVVSAGGSGCAAGAVGGSGAGELGA